MEPHKFIEINRGLPFSGLPLTRIGGANGFGGAVSGTAGAPTGSAANAGTGGASSQAQ
jgi:hypothetical protein